MPSPITMPQQSDTMTEGTVVKWRKKEGDKIKAGEVIAEIETDKAVMEMEAFDAGTLAAVLVPEGQKVAVGTTLALVATGSENPAEVKLKAGTGASKSGVSAPAPSGATASAKPQAAMQTSAVSGSPHTLAGASSGELHEPAGMGHGATRGPATAVPPVLHQGNGHGNGDTNGRRVMVSPLAKRIAADLKLDLSQITGTGPGGRIVQKDVLEASQRAEAAPAPAVPRAGSTDAKPGPTLPERVARGTTDVVPLTKMRTAIATALQRSKQLIPHFYVSVDVDVEELSNLRVRLNKQLEPQGVKVSLNDFVSKATAAALLKHPALNAHWKEDSVVRFGDVHLGIAVAIPDGLIVPVMRNADQMGLKELQQRTAELAKKAKAQRLKGDEMKGATFTISNLGMFGVKDFNAIINPPEVGILAVSAAEKRPVVRGDQIVARTVMTLTLSVDHRAVDGATAAEFMRTLKGLLEEPGMMLV